ncbi:MAG: antibiotic biosynthesis monooxygenase [Candidatus Rokuibacteriota bacterium]|nr:MAG: antibiotic biosynthesis monooxygenase [Candidatus Rokubacteria bacterium]
MYVVCVSVHVTNEHVDHFIEATLENARNTRNEPGNVRFDVLRQEQDPSRFMLYEVYRSPDDFAAHQQTAHYLRWKDTVAGWMAEPRAGVRHRSVFPADAEWK